MTIGTRTPGAWASGSTTVTPALPASPAAGDMMILFVGCKPFSATINQPTGWTRIGTQQTNGSVANGTDVGSVTWSVFYRAWQSGDAAPAVSVTSGNVSLGVIHGYTKTASAWITPTAYFGSDTTSGTGYSITAASSSGAITNGDALLHATVIAGNNATFATPTMSATSATIGTVTESPATEGTTATGLDLEASSSTAACTAGTSTANAVCGWTLSVAQTGGSALVRLREDSTQALTPSLFSNSNSYFTQVVTSTVGLTPSLFSNTQTYYTQLIENVSAQILEPALYTNTNSFYVPTVTTTYDLTQSSRFDNSANFFTHVLSTTYQLTPALFSNSSSFYTHEVANGATTLLPSLFSNTNDFYTPTITVGGVVITPSLYSNANSFYTHSISQASVLLPALYTNSQTFYAATIHNQYPNPSYVLSGIIYGNPNSPLTGTYTDGIKVELSTGRLVKPLSSKVALLL